VTLVNQTPDDRSDLRVRVRVYDLQGEIRDDRTTERLDVASGGSVDAMTLPRVARDSSVYFVRCEVIDDDGSVVAENVYWQSQQRDDVGDPTNDWAFELKQVSWANMTALNWMPKVPLEVSAQRTDADGENGVTIRLRNPTEHVAFFERAEILGAPDDDEILPIEYSDNYVTVFPGETVEVRGVVPTDRTKANWVRVSGYNSPPAMVPIK